MQLRRQLMRQRGFTLVELSIVLTIAGLITAGIWAGVAAVTTNNKTQELDAEFLQVLQNTKTLFAAQGANANVAGFTTAVAINAGIFPPNLTSPALGGVAFSPFGADNPNDPDVRLQANNSKQIEYVVGEAARGLPQSACISLLTTIGTVETMQKFGIVRLGAARSGGAGGINDVGQGGVGVTPAAAAAACNNPGYNNEVIIEMDF